MAIHYRILGGLTLMALVVFGAWPEVDLLVAGWFYDDQKGFMYDFHPATRAIYVGVKIGGVAIGASCLLMFVLQLIGRARPWMLSQRKALYVLLIFALVPGLLVHEIIKPTWDRERPRHVQEFGGAKEFTTIYQVGSGTAKSFVSGHTSGAFSYVALAMVFAGAWRRRIYGAGVAVGVTTAIVRVMQGGHFVSDTVFSALLTLFLVHLIHDIWLRRRDQAD